MRPVGEVRRAVLQAFAQLPARSGTWHDVADAAQVGREVARAAVKRLAAAGELTVVGFTACRSNRPAKVYAPSETQPLPLAVTDLDAALRAWHRTPSPAGEGDVGA